MLQNISLNQNPAFVRPLGQAQNEFLQVLLSHFEVRCEEQSLVLDVDFDYETPTIWLRRSKNYIQDQLDPSRTASVRTSLRRLLLGRTRETFPYADPSFPFRFGNGGALPVIRLAGEDYYCLFYRGVHPVGWNIANGGAESTAELLDPLATIERELREELLIFDPEERSRYVFDWSEGRRMDHPDFVVARAIWQQMFRERDFNHLRELTIPLKWLSGRDRVRIRFDGDTLVEVRDCFLNINAEDFGIEIDRVAKMSVGPKTIFCDGEVVRGKLLNRPVGLFRVQNFNAAIGEKEFSPDRLFWNGRDRTGDDLEKVVLESMDDLSRRNVFAFDTRCERDSAEFKFDLCPVTDILVRRYLQVDDGTSAPWPPAPRRDQSQQFDVFLSFNSECRDLAREVFDVLRRKGRRVFFSDETLHQADFGRAIDDALETAKALVVVGSQAEHFKRRWVEYEWRTFHQDILNYHKPENTPVVIVTQEADRDSLPRPLAHRHLLRWDPSSPETVGRRLEEFLRGSATTRPAEA